MSINSDPREQTTMMSADEIPDEAYAALPTAQDLGMQRDTSGDLYIITTDGYGHLFLVDAENGIERYRVTVGDYGDPDDDRTNFNAMMDLIRKARRDATS